MLLVDIYFSLKHFASGEEKLKNKEWIYFLECLGGKQKYLLEDKMAL